METKTENYHFLQQQKIKHEKPASSVISG